MQKSSAPFTHLRPSTIPESFDRSLAVTFRYAPLVFGAAFVAGADYLVSFAINHIEGVDTENPYLTAGFIFLMLLGDFAGAVSLLAIFQGLLFPTRALAMKPLLRTAFTKLPGYFLTQAIYLVAVVFCVIIAYGLFTAQIHVAQAWLRPILGILATLAGAWVAVRLSLAPVVSLIEETWPLAAFNRSRHLTATLPGTGADSPFLRWLAFMLLPFGVCLLGAISWAFSGYFKGITLPLRSNNPALIDINYSTAFFVTVLALPFFRAALMALYIEYRMRHEALDFYLRLRERRRAAQPPHRA